MSAITPNETGVASKLALTQRRLPRWWAAIGLVAALALDAIVKTTGLITGPLTLIILAATTFIVVSVGWSYSVEGKRQARDRTSTILLWTAFLVAFIPLVSILLTVIVEGAKAFNFAFLTTTMRNVVPFTQGGGVFAGIVGTLEQVGMAVLLAVPIAVLTAIYLVEYAPSFKGQRFPKLVSFFVDVMTGVPSIVAGLFVYTFFVLALGQQRSGFAGSLALTILMIPVVTRATEEMLRVVPNALREGALALGVPRWKTIVRIVLPTAAGGITTGIMLGVARVAGETAPLLLTTFLAQDVNWNLFSGPQASIPTFIWDQFGSFTTASVERAWAGALTLILLVAFFYTLARLIAWRTAPKSR
jgi:phosphate transport system permease protein